MAEHGHDIPYLVLVLIFAVFILTLSLRHVPPAITGYSVNDISWDSGGLLAGFAERSNARSDIYALDLEVVKPIDIKVTGLALFGETLGGRATAQTVGVSDASLCEWVNVKNQDYQEIKALSGNEACRKKGFSTCLMTSVDQSTMYYESSDGSCTSPIFRDNWNELGNCNVRMKTTSTSCIKDANDFRETELTTVFCCK